jgi:hypothetical protein
MTELEQAADTVLVFAYDVGDALDGNQPLGPALGSLIEACRRLKAVGEAIPVSVDALDHGAIHAEIGRRLRDKFGPPEGEAS